MEPNSDLEKIQQERELLERLQQQEYVAREADRGVEIARRLHESFLDGEARRAAEIRSKIETYPAAVVDAARAELSASQRPAAAQPIPPGVESRFVDENLYGALLRERRERAGLNLEQVEGKTGVARRALFDAEAGKSYLRPANQKAVADFLGIDVGLLISLKSR